MCPRQHPQVALQSQNGSGRMSGGVRGALHFEHCSLPLCFLHCPIAVASVGVDFEGVAGLLPGSAHCPHMSNWLLCVRVLGVLKVACGRRGIAAGPECECVCVCMCVCLCVCVCVCVGGLLVGIARYCPSRCQHGELTDRGHTARVSGGGARRVWGGARDA